MITIEHLTKKYGDHVAVDDLNLTIEPGRIYGFLGPNGAGKSTTMNIITGYLAASGGTVTVNGYDIYKDAVKAKAHIGYLPEIPPVYPDMTVLEYLTFVAELKKIPRKQINEEVDEVCVTTGISDVAGRLIRNLSKGYRQRVGLAQAILGNPDIIILDEPTVGLDPAQIIEIRHLIQELGQKHTVILSSHILSEISAVCNYVFIISHGKLVASDETEHLLTMMKGAQEIDITLMTGSMSKSDPAPLNVPESNSDPDSLSNPDSNSDPDSLSDTEPETGDSSGINSDIHTSPDDNKSSGIKSYISAYESLECVDHVDAAPSRENGTISLRIYAVPDTDIRSDIFNKTVECGYILLHMSAQTKSLEDVFLELTSTDESVSINTSDNTDKVSAISDEADRSGSDSATDNKSDSPDSATADTGYASAEPQINDQTDATLTEGGEE